MSGASTGAGGHRRRLVVANEMAGRAQRPDPLLAARQQEAAAASEAQPADGVALHHGQGHLHEWQREEEQRGGGVSRWRRPAGQLAACVDRRCCSHTGARAHAAHMSGPRVSSLHAPCGRRGPECCRCCTGSSLACWEGGRCRGAADLRRPERRSMLLASGGAFLVLAAPGGASPSRPLPALTAPGPAPRR